MVKKRVSCHPNHRYIEYFNTGKIRNFVKNLSEMCKRQKKVKGTLTDVYQMAFMDVKPIAPRGYILTAEGQSSEA